MHDELSALESDLTATDEAVRLKAIKRIITAPQFEEKEAFRFLKALASPLKDESVAVRYYAKKAFSRLKRLVKGSDKALSIPDLMEETFATSKEASPTFIYGSKEFWLYELESKDYRMRVKAIMAVCETMRDSEGAYTRIREMLKSDTHEHVLATIVKYLPRFQRKELFELVSPFLNHPDWRVRANCVEGLETLNDSRAVPLVLPFLSDQDNRVKGNALKYLISSHVTEVQKALKEMLGSRFEWMRDSALYLLSRVEFTVSEDLLLLAIQDASPEIAIKAIESLGKQAGTMKSADGLRKLAQSTKVDTIRTAAERALAEVTSRLPH